LLALDRHCLVIAGRSARITVQQAIHTQTDIELRLAENAKFLAKAARFRLLTLRAGDPPRGFGGHEPSLERLRLGKNVTKVTEAGVRYQVLGVRNGFWNGRHSGSMLLFLTPDT
jgi:hypothetical protein